MVLRLEEADAAINDAHAAPRGIGERERGHPHVARLATEHLDCRRQRLPSRQRLHDVGVAGCGHLARYPFTCDQQRVRRLPRDVLLALRQLKTARHEAARQQVELAQRRCVFTTIRKRNQAAHLGGPRAIRTLPDPVRTLRRRQRVQVQHGHPCRRCGAIARQRRLAPDAAHMRRVLPEVVERTRDESHVRNAVTGLRHRQRGRMDLGKARVPLQYGDGLRVLGAHPVHRSFAPDLFEPAMWIGHGVGSRLCDGIPRKGCNEDGKDE